MLRRKSPSFQRRGSQPRPTSIHAKATCAFEVLLVNQIPPLIKSYQAPIFHIPCNFHFNYLVINKKTGFSQQQQ
jgi:hypothetical protein